VTIACEGFYDTRDIIATEAVDVGLWEPPAEDIGLKSTELLTVVVEEVLTMTDASRIE